MQAFTNVLIKVLAIYLISNALTSAGSFALLQYQQDAAQPLPVEYLIAYMLLPITIGVFLWIYSNKLSASIHKAEMNTDELGLVSAGSFLIGVFLFCQNAGLVIGSYFQIGEIVWPRVITTVIGLLLIASPKAVTTLFKKLKYFDTPSN